MKPYSLDLRERVVAAVEAGEMSRRRVAEVFGVSYYWIKKLFRQKRERGSIAPLPHGGGQKPLFDNARLQRLRTEVARRPDATLEELCERVRGVEGDPVSVSTMSRTLSRSSASREKKKVLSATEQKPVERAEHWELMDALRPEEPRLIFIDESSINTDMTRRFGRAPRGERVCGKIPRNTPLAHSIIGALAPEGLIAAMELEGAVDGLAFAAFVEGFLVPELEPDDIVILDNNATHLNRKALSAY